MQNQTYHSNATTSERRRSRGRKRLFIFLGLLAGLLLVTAAGVAYAGYQYGQRYEGHILPGSSVAGVDVGGMDERQARSAVRKAIGPQLGRTITVAWKDHTWTVTPGELGARSDARAAVREALEASAETSFVERTRLGLFGDEMGFERDVAITYPRQGAKGFVEGIASSLDRDPRDAALDYSTGWVKIVKDRTGRKVQTKASHTALLEALETGDTEVELAVRSVEPEKTTEAYDQVLLVRSGENKLYLYQDGKITHDWTVAPGLPEFRTPTGLFEVTLKRYMPTWVNPSPDGWGKKLPESIGPGLANPLGLRAINWDAPAIRFHGTQALYSLGYNASHGCVRMANEDVIELYDIIDVGTPIVSLEVAALRPLYGTSTEVDEETTKETEEEGGADQDPGEGGAENDDGTSQDG
jgi:lipoprotein-anchoring transpeptidase ErfK/SrfK